MLNDYQLGQGMRRLVFSGKPHPPTLPEFMKLCRTVGHDDSIPDQPPVPSVPALTADDQYDEWAKAANLHLLGVVTRAVRDRRKFDEPQTRILVRYKNLWSDQMRLSATSEGVPVPEQQEVWAECMKRAEAEISAAMPRHPPPSVPPEARMGGDHGTAPRAPDAPSA